MLYEPPPQIQEFNWIWAKWMYGVWEKFFKYGSYPPISGETWVVNYEYPYGAADRFDPEIDGSTDDVTELQAWIDSLGNLGGKYTFPKGTSIISAAINFTQPFNLVGAGTQYSAIDSSAGSETINITPSASVDLSLSVISSLSLMDTTDGTLGSGRGIYLSTPSATQFLPKLTFRDLNIGTSSGFGIQHLNNILNLEGGMYAARFENLIVRGGIKLEGSGDSNTISHSIISGTGLGVWASLAQSPNASLLAVENCNITNANGAIRIDAGSRFRLLGNNTENTAAGTVANNDSACWNISGDNGVIYGGVIKENLLSRYGSSDATHLLKLANCRGTLVQDNVLLSDSGSTVSVEIASDCQDVRIGPNTYNSNVADSIVDNGVGTMGLLKTPSLSNSWVEFSATENPVTYIKDLSGIVHIQGQMKNGTTTNGTTIFTLPARFRPTEIVRSQIGFVTGGAVSSAQMVVESNGVVSINYITDSAQVMINLSFPAADLANGVSLE